MGPAQGRRHGGLDEGRRGLRTPGYHDYHWIAGPETDRRFGTGFTDRLRSTVLSAHTDPDGTKVLGLLGAKKFVPTVAANYNDIEKIGRKLGLIG